MGQGSGGVREVGSCQGRSRRALFAKSTRIASLIITTQSSTLFEFFKSESFTLNLHSPPPQLSPRAI
ncbi:hypothetical protein E2C01_001709 [Portunus trituberculatus]|uniref:Uncharacterized protein n=1 Tax=Portunus trituberculatus TaxID=210409 RepID=A0A5B7CL32_PORTR|nr:hypothetical protein [Portunus trituberculatus]